jgi:hypothetical protein
MLANMRNGIRYWVCVQGGPRSETPVAALSCTWVHADLEALRAAAAAGVEEEEKQEGEEQKDRVVAMLEELQSGRWNGIDSPPGQEAFRSTFAHHGQP